jgi:hypothetical protein
MPDYLIVIRLLFKVAINTKLKGVPMICKRKSRDAHTLVIKKVIVKKKCKFLCG